MDNHRFDDLTKAVATGTSRRWVLRALVAGLASAVSQGSGLETTRGARKCNGSGGACNPKKDRPCCKGATCIAGKCCHNEAICDGATCFDLKKDPRNCGECNQVCTTDVENASAICDGGVCSFACSNGYQHCGGACIPDGGCCVDADCDDGNACTVAVCGPISHTCYNVPVTESCTECSSGDDCAGGVCCHGRCCAAGSTCGGEAAGVGLCCVTCDTGSCCDVIAVDSGSLDLYPATCSDTTQFPDLPSFCCIGGGVPSYIPDPVTGEPTINCVLSQRFLP